MELPLELEDAIRAAPDDREAYLVAADWLQDRGALQGELVVEDDRERAIGLLPPALRGDSPFTFEWRWGFVRGVLLASMKDAGEPRLLRELLASPIARFVQKLVVQNASSRIVEAICDVGEPRALSCLRTLMLFVDDTATPLDLARLPKSLRRLVLRVTNTTRALALPALLELSLDRLNDPSRVVALSELPALEMLQIGTGWDRLEPNRWLEPERLPSLETLTLSTVGGPFDWRVWQDSRIAVQLHHLDLFEVTPRIQTQRTFVIDRRGSPEPAALLAMVGPQRGDLRVVERPSHPLATRKRDRHAELQYELGHWVIRRYNATAHTFVNGYDVTQCPLRHLDEIAVGEHVYRFLEGDVGAAAAQLRTRYGL